MPHWRAPNRLCERFSRDGAVLPAHNLQRLLGHREDTNVRLVDLPSANGKFCPPPPKKAFGGLAAWEMDAQVAKNQASVNSNAVSVRSAISSPQPYPARQPPKLFIDRSILSVEEVSFVSHCTGAFTEGPSRFLTRYIDDDCLLRFSPTPPGVANAWRISTLVEWPQMHAGPGRWIQLRHLRSGNRIFSDSAVAHNSDRCSPTELAPSRANSRAICPVLISEFGQSASRSGTVSLSR